MTSIKTLHLFNTPVWYRPDLEGYYLCFIDLDNQKAIEEVCTIFGVKDIDELGKTTIVYHLTYIPKPFSTNSSPY